MADVKLEEATAIKRFLVVDVYLCEGGMRRALEDCLRDEPQRLGLLRVEELEPPHPPLYLLTRRDLLG